MKIAVDLHGVDLGLILMMHSGVVYTNQADGVACLQLEEEGVLAPFAMPAEQPYSKGLCDYFLSRPGNRGCLEIADADFIDAFLLTTWVPFSVKVDRTRLAESYEAWVYVNLDAYSGSIPVIETPKGLTLPMNAVLVWENSD